MTPLAKALLKHIGAAGCFGGEIPDDDDTSEALCELTEAGLIFSTPARFDDYFELTKAGLVLMAKQVGKES